ncbi:MAG: hypothetical protein WAT71_13535 [Ignavibacteria bacterium]
MTSGNIRFFEIYNCLSETEKKEFSEFVTLSLFSKRKTYKDILKKLNSDPKKETIQIAFENKRTISNRLSELTKLVEKFLVIKRLESDKFQNDILLLEELKERNVNKFYEQRFNSLSNSILKKDLSLKKNDELYRINYLSFENSKVKLNNERTIDSIRKNFDIRLIQFMIETFDYAIKEFYFRIYNPVITDNFRLSILETLDIEFIINYFKKNLVEYYPVVSFYNYILKAFLNLDDTYSYNTAKKIFSKELNNVSKDLRSVLYKYMFEYFIVRMNYKRQSSSKELFDLVNDAIKEELLENEFKSDTYNSAFTNYTMNALSLHKIQWAEEFIDKFGKFLPQENRENGVLQCKAFVEYYKSNFKECKMYAGKVKKINTYYYFNSSKLFLQSCFELGSLEECYAEIKRLQEYLRLQKNSNETLTKYAHEFCLCFILLLRLNENPVSNNYIKLEFELNKNGIGGKTWIEKKMKEIKISN